jgi:hypothetical protein
LLEHEDGGMMGVIRVVAKGKQADFIGTPAGTDAVPEAKISTE